MTDHPADTPSPPDLEFLRLQSHLSLAFALSLARDLGLTPEEAGTRFWHGLAIDRPPRPLTPPQLEAIVHDVAATFRLLYGNAQIERAGTGWHIITTVTETDRRALQRWNTPLEYLVRWLAAIQRHEGVQILTDWSTRLDGDRIIQELTPRG